MLGGGVDGTLRGRSESCDGNEQQEAGFVGVFEQLELHFLGQFEGHLGEVDGSPETFEKQKL